MVILVVCLFIDARIIVVIMNDDGIYHCYNYLRFLLSYKHKFIDELEDLFYFFIFFCMEFMVAGNGGG
jgi:hypothetical protein